MSAFDPLATFSTRATVKPMHSPTVIRTALEWSLCLLLIPAALISLEWLVVGVTFGSNLWRPDRPVAITMWIAGVLFPAFVAWALARSLKAQSLATTARWTLATWGLAGFWLVDVYVTRWGW